MTGVGTTSGAVGSDLSPPVKGMWKDGRWKLRFFFGGALSSSASGLARAAAASEVLWLAKAAAVVSGPDAIQPSEWLPQVWSEGSRSSAAAFANNDEAQKIMALVLRHLVGIQRTLGESPTRFKPLLYMPEEKARGSERMPPEGTAWCEGYMAGVKLRDNEWQVLFDAPEARDWIFPIEALAFGDRDDDFTEWVDSDEKRAELIDELPVAAVLIYRFWQERREAKRPIGAGARRGVAAEVMRKSRQRLH